MLKWIHRHTLKHFPKKHVERALTCKARDFLKSYKSVSTVRPLSAEIAGLGDTSISLGGALGFLVGELSHTGNRSNLL